MNLFIFPTAFTSPTSTDYQSKLFMNFIFYFLNVFWKFESLWLSDITFPSVFYYQLSSSFFAYQISAIEISIPHLYVSTPSTIHVSSQNFRFPTQNFKSTTIHFLINLKHNSTIFNFFLLLSSFSFFPVSYLSFFIFFQTPLLRQKHTHTT